MRSDEFFQLVAPELPMCPIPVLASMTWTVLDEYCRRTMCWEEDLDPIQIVPGERTYDLDPPVGASVYLLSHARPSGTKVDMQASINHAGELVLQDVPASAAVLEVKAVLMPKPSGMSFPEAVMARHTLAIASGVKYRLMAMPPLIHTPWSNQATAPFYRGLFEEAVASAISDRLRGLTTKQLFVKPVPFGFSRNPS